MQKSKQLPLLKFAPIFKEIIWGGNKLETLLCKNLPTGKTIGESWELVDLPDDQSEVCSKNLRGENLKGKKLCDIVKEYKSQLLGDILLPEDRFPLLFKFIDAQKTLSVQVHPDREACNKLGKGARPKTEAWYIIDCEKDAVLYVGLKKGITKQMFMRGIEQKNVDKLLYQLPVNPGDYIYLPAGTIHAIGKGIVLAEVQQSSNTTYRIFDWNRVGLDGNPRQLHIEQAMEAINFNQFGVPNITAPDSGRPGIKCNYFEMETIKISNEVIKLKGNGSLVLMGVKGQGSIQIQADNYNESLSLGETLLVPFNISNEVIISAKEYLTCLAIRITA